MKRLTVIIILFFSLFGVKNMGAQVGVSITVAPPALPVYAQPPCPEDGYLWSPGYWAYGPDGYYWVPGVWVAPPEVGLLWTPGYWGFVNGAYLWYGGYWGPTIGFYGGVCYGWGYGGHGFYGGRWEGGHFMYNTAAWHVNGAVIHNTYVDKTVIHNSGSRASFNGRGGVEARPTASEQAAMKEKHTPATSSQRSHERTASMNKNQLASVNKGRPGTTSRSTVGGQRFTSGGHSISSTHTAAQPASHNAAPKPQAQARPAQQSRPAAQPQHNNNNVQKSAPARQAAPTARQAAPQRQAAPPPARMGGGGRSMGGGGGGGRKH